MVGAQHNLNIWDILWVSTIDFSGSGGVQFAIAIDERGPKKQGELHEWVCEKTRSKDEVLEELNNDPQSTLEKRCERFVSRYFVADNETVMIVLCGPISQ